MTRPKVVMFPDWRGQNPFQDLLARHLDAAGLDVTFVDGHPARTLPALLRRPDVVHLHWIEFLNDLPWHAAVKVFCGVGAARIRGARIVWTVHNLQAHELRTRRRKNRVLSLVAGRLAHRVIAMSETGAAAAQARFDIPPSKMAVIPHGNYLSSYPNGISRESARRALGIDEQEFVFGFVGLLRPYKGIDDLLRAFEGIVAPAASLLIAGEPLDAELERSIVSAAGNPEKRTRYFPGFIEDDRLQVFLNAVDVVVLPYKEILTSGSAILALSFGRVFIGPKIGCLADFDGEPFFISYDPRDPAGLASAMRRAMDLGPRLQELETLALDKARSLDWDEIAGLHRIVYSRDITAASTRR